MATQAKRRRLSELSGEELDSLLGLIGSSDSVELKVTLPADEHRATIRALGLDPLDGPDPADLLLRHARSRR